MARTITRYLGSTTSSTTIYTVPVGKIAKIIFTKKNNFSNVNQSSYYYSFLYKNSSNVENRLFGVNKILTNAATKSYDGNLYIIDSDNGDSESNPQITDMIKEPFMMLDGETLNTKCYGTAINWDFIVIEETL